MATRLLGFITHHFRFPFSLQRKTSSLAASTAEPCFRALRQTAPLLHCGLLTSGLALHHSICPAPHPQREGPQHQPALGTADKGWVPDTPPFTEKGRRVITMPPAPAIHHHGLWEPSRTSPPGNVIPLPDTTAPSYASALPVT